MNSALLPTSATLVRVADYARLSEDDEKDPELRGENVAIQLDECRLFREQRADWQRVGSFKDNDKTASAYGDVVREDFEKLMALVRASGVDIILCVEVTRLGPVFIPSAPLAVATMISAPVPDARQCATQ